MAGNLFSLMLTGKQARLVYRALESSSDSLKYRAAKEGILRDYAEELRREAAQLDAVATELTKWAEAVGFRLDEES
ncbi:MAG: hypothetical protein EKK29_08380 [Hyphomicrobiales bacterium]|nr:MAG: hypothetical protein EKK29_08380 [Hyphomicrobiales bacterium]